MKTGCGETVFSPNASKGERSHFYGSFATRSTITDLLLLTYTHARAQMLLCSGALFLFLLTGVHAWGQAEAPSGTIVGTVTDSTGAVIPNATVTATNTGTGISLSSKTNVTGNYSFPLLQVGTYSVAVEATGFNRFLASGLTLSASATVRVDARLQVGQTSTTVQVSVSSASLLQTDTSTVSATLEQGQVENLPLNGRNFVELLRTTPGVEEGQAGDIMSGTRPDDRRQTSSLSADGQPANYNNEEIDGMDNNERFIGTIGVRPSIDAIQEVSVQTNLYRANASRTAGAVVNVITKSGTNSFHGSLYEFVRNDKFDAKDYFNTPQAGNPVAGIKPEYRQNQFGGSIGGPIRRDKTFFFGDFEELRYVQGSPSSTQVPSPCELGAVECGGYQGLGNFSDMLPGTIIYNPVTQAPYSYNGFANVIPPDEIDPISKAYAGLFPTNSQCASGPTSCLFYSAPNLTHYAYTTDGRIDEHFSEKTYLFGRYTLNNLSAFTPGALPPLHNYAGVPVVQPGGDPGSFSYPGPNHTRSQNLALTLTHTFSPNLVGQLVASYTRVHIASLPLNTGVNVNTAFGGPPVNVSNGINNAGSGLANVTFNNYTYLGDDAYIPLEYNDNTFQYSGNVILTRGNQTISFGLAVIRRQALLAQSPYDKGNFNFTGLLTNSCEGCGSGTGGNDFAQFLSGYSDALQRQLTLVSGNTRSWEPSAYFQDDWRAKSWLTLNLGIRYDIITPFTCPQNCLSNFDPTVPSVYNGGQVIIAGQGGWGPTAGIITDLRNWAPRIGFAASAPHSMVVRGGFGMSYFPTNLSYGAQLPNQPFTSTTLIPAQYGQSPGYVPPYFGESLGPATPTPTCLSTVLCGSPADVITAVNQGQKFNYRNAYAYQYSLEVQKQIAGSNALTIGYVGAIDRHLQTAPNLDAPLPPMGPGGCGTTRTISLPDPCQPFYALYPTMAADAENMDTGALEFNGMQVDFKHPAGHGLGLDTNFTYGRDLDDVSGINSLIPNDPLYDWGNSSLDTRFRWNLSISYELPVRKSLTGFAGEAFKGWSLNTIAVWSSGLPFTVGNSGDPQMNTGQGTDRPDMVHVKLYQNQSINHWFNIQDFRLQPYGTAGNEKNDQLYGPSMKKVDLSLFKDFPIKERATLQFRAETFNLFNTPNFANPHAHISSWSGTGPSDVPTSDGDFGVITATNANFPARQIQFALKLLF